jgi:hypothetical protein
MNCVSKLLYVEQTNEFWEKKMISASDDSHLEEEYLR